IQRAGDEVTEELSHAASFAVTTGADGAAVFDWLPSDLEDNAQFAVRSRDYWWDRRLIVSKASTGGRFRLVRLSDAPRAAAKLGHPSRPLWGRVRSHSDRLG